MRALAISDAVRKRLLVASLALFASACSVDLSQLQSGTRCSANLQTDADNCGECGHSCFGGECIAGECQPLQLADKQKVSSFWGLGQTGNTVLWSVDDPTGDLRSVPKIGGYSPKVLGLTNGGAGPIAVNETGMTFYAVGPKIYRCPAADKCEVMAYASSPVNEIRALLIDGGNVYWTEWLNAKGAGAIQRCAIQASCTSPFQNAWVDGLSQPEGLVADDKYIYWAEQGRVSRSLKAEQGNPEILMTSADSYHGVAVTADRVFASAWGAADRIVSCVLPCGKSASIDDLTGGTPASVQRPVAIAVDGQDVYWANTTGTSIVRCTAPKCRDAAEIAHDIPAPRALVLDDTSVYWTDAAGGVYRLAE